MDRKLNVLVVDDEQIVLDSVRKHLGKEDYVIHTALAADKALELVRQGEIDIVLTDLMMPEIDGLEFMRLVKVDFPHLPVIMITGYATINTALQATQLGAFDYVAKPFTRKELQGVVRRAAEMASPPDSAQRGQITGERSDTDSHERIQEFKSVGDNAWLMLRDDGIVVFGVEHSFLQTIGTVQNIYLPSIGDKLRQGGTYLQIMSTDMRSHSLVSPLSGTVVEVNQKVIDDPQSALQDPFGEGWLIRLQPSRFDLEIKELGL
ncbi:MAG: response regulator [candidate division Zixibacteria bacterium]|nr:response regulator [candidate division Zixibacteria bacterium]